MNLPRHWRQKPEDVRLSEARAKLAELQEHRRQLLLQRTPAHPEVQQVEAKIVDAQQQLAAISSEVGVEAANTPPVQSLAASPQERVPSQTRPSNEIIQNPPRDEFADSMQAIRSRLEEIHRPLATETSEAQRAFRALENKTVEIQWAQAPQRLAEDLRSVDLLALAMTAGLAGMAGLGLVYGGVRIDTPTDRR